MFLIYGALVKVLILDFLSFLQAPISSPPSSLFSSLTPASALAPHSPLEPGRASPLAAMGASVQARATGRFWGERVGAGIVPALQESSCKRGS